MEGGKLRASYEEDLNRLKTAQKNAAIADLENTRNQALSNLEAERNQNTTLYNQQRSTANAQNRMQAKNFQEYLAATGRANSGLPAQARMQYDNNLQNSLSYLNAGEAGALADINRRSTLAHDNYNSGLASANANIEANYIQSLLDERNKDLDRQLQERKLQEEIRQFNENLALQRESLNRSSYSNNYITNNQKSEPTYEVNTAYYQGAKNPDAQYGTFSNGYQPDNIGGQKLTGYKKNGEQQYMVINTQTSSGQKQQLIQKVWKTPDGTLWYWDGRQNKYLRYTG